MSNIQCDKCGWIYAAHAAHSCPNLIKQAIRDEIARAGWTQRELAARARMTQPALARYLNTDREIRSDVLERLLDALNLEITRKVHA